MSVAYSAAAAAFLEPDSVASERPRLMPVPSLPPRGTDPGWVLLRNVGGKPLRLRADLLAEGSNRSPDSVAWHEVALYRVDSGEIAVALRFLRLGGAETGVHRARLFADMDEASAWLEEFDPAADLSAEFDVADTRVSAAGVALKAAALRDRVECLDRAYRGLIGEVLYQLESER